MKKTLLAITLAVAFSGAAQAATKNWTGTFENAADFKTYEFIVGIEGATDGVEVFTSSYATGGFDAALFVWDAAGFLVGYNNNKDAAGNMDASVAFNRGSDFGLLAEGTYSFTIVNYPSYVDAPVIGVTTVNDISFASTPGVLPGGYGNEFHVTATGVVPEPETWAMLLAGLGVMGSVARRRQK
ncbi:MAG: DVUA0089 family protein [Azoarcus sp.]|nr:DVUA0089 family protein [Azoarcus sp.]